MCTSMAPGFYIRDMENFEHWKKQIKALKEEYKNDCIFGMFDTAPFQFQEDISESESSGSEIPIDPRKMSERVSNR